MSVRVGSVELANPVMTASGTAGYGTELAAYMDLSALGAVVVKSLAAYEWAGNPAPRLHPTPQGMLNAVGLQGPGLPYWLDHVLPDLLHAGATVVASIWGRTRRRLRPRRRAAGRRAARGRRRGDQPVVPQPRGSRRHLRPRRRPGRSRHCRDGRRRPAEVGQAQRQYRPDRRDRRCRRRGGRRGRHLRQHAARARLRPASRASRRSAPAAAGSRGGRSTRSPSAPCTTSTPLTPTCRSSVSVACPVGGTPPSC